MSTTTQNTTVSAAPGGKSDQRTHALEIVAPGNSPLVTADDALLGQQLTEQFQRATGGIKEVLKFGAMMMMLRENFSTRGEVSGGRGKKGGMSEWLKTHAPDVAESTAYRFMHVAEAVQAEFKLPKKVSFLDLATKPAEALPAPLREKQLELFQFIQGTSRNSWLDRFKPAKLRGGDTSGGEPAKEQTPEEKYEAALAAITERAKDLGKRLHVFTKLGEFKALDDASLDGLCDEADTFIRSAKAWLNTPKNQRLPWQLQAEHPALTAGEEEK